MPRTSRNRGDGWPVNEFLLNQMLVWVHCAERPLTVKELQHAVAIRPHRTEMHKVDIPDISHMRIVSSGLLEMGRPFAKVKAIADRSKKYLNQSLGCWLDNAQTEIARACLTYLRYSVFLGEKCSSDEEFEERLEENPFYEYAASNWGYHAREALLKAKEATERLSKSNSGQCPTRGQFPTARTSFNFEEYETLKEEIINFLQGGPCYDSALQAIKAAGPYYNRKMARSRGCFRHRLHHNYNQRPLCRLIGLHFAAWFGLTDVIPALIEDGQSPNSKTAYGRTPLSWAAALGHNDVVSLLIDQYGADPQIRSNGGACPLNFAASMGHESVVRQLIDIYGVDVESPSKIMRTALAEAAMHGHEGIVRYLVERGADVDATESLRQQTPLIFAVRACSKRTVETLIKAGATLSCIDTGGRTALGYAVQLGYIEIATMLYQASPKASPAVLYGPKGLSAAASARMRSLIQFLAKSDRSA